MLLKEPCPLFPVSSESVTALELVGELRSSQTGDSGSESILVFSARFARFSLLVDTAGTPVRLRQEGLFAVMAAKEIFEAGTEEVSEEQREDLG